MSNEFESIIETLKILNDQKIVNDIKESEKDFKEGKYVSLEEIKKNLGIRIPELILRGESKA